MTYREKFEDEVERINVKMQAIADQTALVAKIQRSLSRSLEKAFEGDLQKNVAGATEFRKRLTVCKRELMPAVRAEMEKLLTLQSECREAQTRARSALPDYAKFLTNGREDTVPGRTIFQAEKGGTASPLKMPVQKQSIPMASLSDVQLARRFQR